MMRLRAIAALLCAAAALGACEKNGVQDITGPVPSARIKFFNFGMGSPGVNFYANDTKLTALSSATGAENRLGVAYGAVGAGGLYTGIEPGQYTLSGRIADTIPKADKDRVVSSVATTIENGKFYSFYQSGVYSTATKTVDAFVVEDPLPSAVDYSAAQVRFVNAIHNSTPMTLYAKNTTTGQEFAIGGAVAYKSAGAFAAVPEGIYDLSTRRAGQTTNAIVRTGVSLSSARIYTIGARGDMTVTGATAVNRPFLDNATNR